VETAVAAMIEFLEGNCWPLQGFRKLESAIVGRFRDVSNLFGQMRVVSGMFQFCEVLCCLFLRCRKG